MRFADVGEENLSAAGYVHSESWKESHRGFCSAEFVARHTPQAQTDYLRRELAAGKRIYMLLDPHPVGIVSVWGGLIENLYVLPGSRTKGTAQPCWTTPSATVRARPPSGFSTSTRAHTGSTPARAFRRPETEGSSMPSSAK